MEGADGVAGAGLEGWGMSEDQSVRTVMLLSAAFLFALALAPLFGLYGPTLHPVAAKWFSVIVFAISIVVFGLAVMPGPAK